MMVKEVEQNEPSINITVQHWMYVLNVKSIRSVSYIQIKNWWTQMPFLRRIRDQFYVSILYLIKKIKIHSIAVLERVCESQWNTSSSKKRNYSNVNNLYKTVKYQNIVSREWHVYDLDYGESYKCFTSPWSCQSYQQTRRNTAIS